MQSGSNVTFSCTLKCLSMEACSEGGGVEEMISITSPCTAHYKIVITRFLNNTCIRVPPSWLKTIENPGHDGPRSEQYCIVMSNR